MASSVAAQVMRQAETVKKTMTESGKAFSELWVTRQKLEDLYKKLLLIDLEYALDKKVEQELWNHAFKNQINVLQTQSKDRQNPKKMEANASLFLFLETASGFYLQFLQTICSTFKLDLPFRRRSAAFGIMRENTVNYKNIVTPKKSSCLYICCHCLVHLGDIARYRGEMLQAQTYYRHAANLSPNNGQPYNQLAILEASQGDKLSTVFYYVRSLAVRHPFPVAATNLEKFYFKLIKDTRSDFDGPNLTMTDIIVAFLQFQALLHLSTGLDRASNLKIRITSVLGSHIRGQSVSAAHLTGMVAIAVFALHRARCDTNESGESIKKTVLSSDEERCIQIHLSFAAKLLETMLLHTPKEDNKARDFLTLPAVKVLFDWLSLNRDVLLGREFNNTSIWSDLCKLLNTLQWLLNDFNKASDTVKYEDRPLPEDADLRCFQPLDSSYCSYNFNKALNEELSPPCERDLRCQRLVAHGKWIAQDLPRQKLLIYQPSKSIRTQFSTQKVSQPGDKEQTTTPHKSSNRQNVAMQTIMKKRMEQDKGPASPLSVISEERRSSLPESQKRLGGSTPPTPGQQGQSQRASAGTRQAGVINLHHKNTSTNNKPNLPPRLSAKAGISQNSSVSPRLQKKGMVRGNNNSTASSGRGNTSTGKAPETETAGRPDASPSNATNELGYMNQEAYPSLSVDNYPALVSQRSQASLIPTETPGQPVTSGNAASSSLLSAPNWGALNLGRDSGPGTLSLSQNLTTASPSLDCSSTASRSPQPSSGTVGSYPSDQQQTGRTMEPGPMGGFAAPSTDFMSAIRSANQFVQQQQNLQMLSPEIQQYPQHPLYNQQHMNRMLSTQQQLHQMSRSPSNFYPGQGMLSEQNATMFGQAPTMRPQSGNMMVPGQSSHTTNVLGGLNLPPPTGSRGTVGPVSSQVVGDVGMPPPGSVGKAQSVGYQTTRMDKSMSRSYMSNPAPVGYILPASLSGDVGGAGFPTTAPPSTAGHMGMARPLGGLLYQNIPLAGQNKPGGGERGGSNPAAPGGSAAMAALFQTAGVQAPQNPAAFAQYLSAQQGYRSGGKVNSTNQDPRLTTSFQGHAAGTPKPDTGGLDIQSQMPPKQSILPHHSQRAPPPLAPKATGLSASLTQLPQSMIHTVMDPPFLQASGEYTLFNNNSSPAWPTPLVKTSSSSTGKHAQSDEAVGMVKMAAGGGPQVTNQGFTGGNMQGMWSGAGPSALERLLEQQRTHRQGDG